MQTAPGSTPICTASMAISITPAIGTGRRGAKPATGKLDAEWAAIAAALLKTESD